VHQLARDKAIDPAAIEVWFADEARIGQKNKITRRWARHGSRPSAPHDQRTAPSYRREAVMVAAKGILGQRARIRSA